MAWIPQRLVQQRDTKAAVNAPAPAPASSRRTVRGNGPNMEAMKSATGVAVRNCPSSSWRVRGFPVATDFMTSCYQTDPSYASRQTEQRIPNAIVSAKRVLRIEANRSAGDHRHGSNPTSPKRRFPPTRIFGKAKNGIFGAFGGRDEVQTAFLRELESREGQKRRFWFIGGSGRGGNGVSGGPGISGGPKTAFFGSLEFPAGAKRRFWRCFFALRPIDADFGVVVKPN